MSGVCRYRKPCAWKKSWVAQESALRMRATAPMVLVRGRRCIRPRRNCAAHLEGQPPQQGCVSSDRKQGRAVGSLGGRSADVLMVYACSCRRIRPLRYCTSHSCTPPWRDCSGGDTISYLLMAPMCRHVWLEDRPDALYHSSHRSMRFQYCSGRHKLGQVMLQKGHGCPTSIVIFFFARA